MKEQHFERTTLILNAIERKTLSESLFKQDMIATSSKQQNYHEEDENHNMLIESEHWNHIVALLSQVHRKEANVAKLVTQLQSAVVDVKKINSKIRDYLKKTYPEFYDQTRIDDQQVKSRKMEMRKKLSVHMKETNLSKYTEIAKTRPTFLNETSNFALDSTEYKTSLSKAIDIVIKDKVSISVVISNN